MHSARLATQLTSLEMELATCAQILDEAVCVSLHANTIRKGMNPSVLSPAIVEY